MKKIIAALFICFFIISCSTTKNTVSEPAHKNTTVSAGKDGSSYENAISINEKSESKGVDAEYAWLRANYPGCEILGQTLNFYNNKPYDIITIKTKEGTEKKIHFDISGFFGKF